MGKLSGWKDVLNREFKYCRIVSIPDDVAVTAIIDDMSLNIRRVMYGLTNWDELGRRLRRRITSADSKHLKRYVVTFEEPDNVPASKQPEQETRKIRTQKDGIFPLSDEENAALIIESGAVLPTTGDAYLQRMMATRGVHDRLYAFCTEQIASAVFPPIVTTDTGENRRETRSVDLIIDGARLSTIDERTKRDPSGADVVLIDSSSVDKDKPAYASVSTRRNENDKAIVRAFKSMGIGEGDLKIVAAISDVRGGNVVVRSCDSDTIPILLLNMRRWLDPATGQSRFGIFIDMTSRYAAPKDGEVPRGDIVDIVSLWRSIHVHFRSRYPGIRHPIETVALLMILTGCDYGEGFRKLGPATIWRAFEDGGSDILCGRKASVAATADDYADANTAPNSTPSTDMNYGNKGQRYPLTYNEDNIVAFVTYAYHRELVPKPKKRKVNGVMIYANGQSDHPYFAPPSMAENRRIARAKDATYKDEKSMWKIRTNEEIAAVVRRTWWTQDYWMNGTLRTNPYMNPTAMDRASSKSLHGWEVGVNRSTGLQRVECAGVVHVAADA